MSILRGQRLAGFACVWLMGCASMGPPVPPELELPKPPTDLRAVRKGDRVTLTWTVPARTTDRQSVRFLGKTRICRAQDAALHECTTPIGEASAPAEFSKKTSSQKVTVCFTDTLPQAKQQSDAGGFATYAVEVLNTSGRGAGISNQARISLLPTLPPFNEFRVQVSAQGVMISWKCPEPSERALRGVKYLLRLFRVDERTAGSKKIADVEVTSCVSEPQGSEQNVHSFLDVNFEWEKAYTYHGAVVSRMEAAGKEAVEVEGDDTPEAKIFAHDVFPPGVPSALQAVFSGPGQEAFIDLIWNPVSDADLDGYNVYRHEAGGAPVKVNMEPVRASAFRDVKVAGGKNYFYSVSAVDERGNESEKSEEASERVP